MSNLAVNVKWQEVLRECASGDIPHCRAISAPVIYHPEIIASLARIILGKYRPSHPDLLIIGTSGKAPPIGDPAKPGYEGSARWLIENLALKPLESQRRMGVVMCADKLLLPAANSLLKLAEEPPEHAVLLFLMTDGRLFLPTLKSRSRFTAIPLNELNETREVHAVPKTPADWVKWLANARKDDADTITSALEAWSNYASDAKDYVHADRIDGLRLIAEKKNLSVNMLCDMIILMLGDDNTKNEHILDDIR